MEITRELVFGSMLEQNSFPADAPRSVLHLPGTFQDLPARFGVSEEELGRHTLLVGGTGTGKSNLFFFIVEQLKKVMGPNDVMLIFDTKEDYLNRFRALGDLVIGNSKAYQKLSERWSLYREITADGLDRQAVVLNAQEISRALFADMVERNNSNPFFPNAARDLFAAIMIALIRSGQSFTNRELRAYLDCTPPKDIVDLLWQHQDMRNVATYINGKAGGQSQGVLSELYQGARDILLGVFAEDGDFSMRSFIRKKGGKTLFLEYDLSIGGLLSPIYSLLFDLALKEALGRNAAAGNVFLIADELKLLPHLQHLEDGINFGRGQGVRIFAGLQSIDQLEANYADKSKARNIIAGFSSLYAFRSNDYSTRNYVTETFGKNLTFERYQEPDGRFHLERCEGYTVGDWDLLKLRTGEAVVGLPQRPPFRFRFQEYPR